MGTDGDERALAAGRRVIEANAAAVAAAAGALGEAFSRVTARITRSSGKLITTGSGTSGYVAARAAHLFSVGGTPSFYLPPADGLHGALGAVAPGDIVLALSKGGSSHELNLFCERAKARAGTLIVITATATSPLTALADEVIVMTLPEAGDLGDVIATASSLAAATVTDALVEAVREARNVDWADVLQTHPSGAVGRDAATTIERLKGRP